MKSGISYWSILTSIWMQLKRNWNRWKRSRKKRCWRQLHLLRQTAEEVADAGAEDRQGQAGDVLVRAERDRQQAEAGLGENASSLEKLSWTHEMKTDDQVILATAKMANKGAADSVSKVQEMTQTSDRISGTSETVDDKKYADREDAEEGKQM